MALMKGYTEPVPGDDCSPYMYNGQHTIQVGETLLFCLVNHFKYYNKFFFFFGNLVGKPKLLVHLIFIRGCS